MTYRVKELLANLALLLGLYTLSRLLFLYFLQQKGWLDGGHRFIRGSFERAVDEGRAAVAFSMFPVTVDDLIAVSDAGAIMPPKSTWFEPKLRDGLLIHVI